MTKRKVPARRNNVKIAKTVVKRSKQTKASGRSLTDFQPLLPAEQKLLDAVAIGEMCWLCDEKNPVRPEEKTKDNEIRANFIRFLALGGDENTFVHEQGVMLTSAYISGELDLINCRAALSLIITYSEFEKKISLQQCEIEFIDFSHSRFLSFWGAGFVVKATIKLHKIISRTQMDLTQATIHGSLEMNGASLNGGTDKSPIALMCRGITITKNIKLCDSFKSLGSVDFLNAVIKGDLECHNSTFSHLTPESPTKLFHFQSAKIGGDVLLSDNFHAEGQVRFKNAKIGGDFKCEEDSSIDNAGGTALNCSGITVDGNVLLRGSENSQVRLEIKGKVNFMDAKIGKSFDCSYAELTNLEPESEGSAIADYALNLQGANIGGVLTLRHSDIYGSLCLLKAHADTLNDRADSWPQPAIFQKTGIRHKLKNSWNTILAQFWVKPASERETAVKTGIGSPEHEAGELLSVEGDETETITPNQKTSIASSAGLSSVIALDGFSYNQIAGGSPTDSEARLTWLKLQRPTALWKTFRPQPFEQIISVLRKTGYEEEATQMLIAKYDHKQEVRIEKANGFWGNLWAWLQSSFFWLFLGRATGYGKRPARLLLLLAFLFTSSSLWYSLSASKGIFAPSHPLIFLKYNEKEDCRKNWVNCINDGNKNPELQAYTAFSPWLYSLDVMLPIINLHQESDWGPKIEGFKVSAFGTHWEIHDHLTWFVMWSQIILGWLGSFMLIAMLSGWLQKE